MRATRRWWLLGGLVALLLLALAVLGGRPIGRDASTAPPAIDARDGGFATGGWYLTGYSPDGRLLALAPTHEAVCATVDGWQVEQDADGVHVAPRWIGEDIDDCPAVGIDQDLLLELDAPLGARDLTGCGHADCRGLAPPPRVGADAPYLRVAHDLVVVGGRPPRLLDADGTELDGPTGIGGWVVAAPGRLLQHGPEARLVGRDPRSGQQWEASGITIGDNGQTGRPGVTDDLVVVCSFGANDVGGDGGGGDGGAITALGLTDGEAVWRVDEPCLPTGAALAGDRVVSLVSGGLDEETSVGLTVRGLADGRLLRDVDLGLLPVRAHEAAVVAAGTAFLAGAEDGLVQVDLRTGAPSPLAIDGWPIGTAEDVLLVREHSGRLLAYDPATRQQPWHEHLGLGDQTLAASASVSAGALFVFHPAGDEVTRRDPQDGSVRWRADIGRSAAATVAAAGDTVYVATLTSLLALDLADGTLRWELAHSDPDLGP